MLKGTVAAQEASLQNTALTAGYKAKLTCSATFNAGKTVEQIAADELDSIYPNFATGMDARGEARIDAHAKIVSDRIYGKHATKNSRIT